MPTDSLPPNGSLHSVRASKCPLRRVCREARTREDLQHGAIAATAERMDGDRVARIDGHTGETGDEGADCAGAHELRPRGGRDDCNAHALVRVEAGSAHDKRVTAP